MPQKIKVVILSNKEKNDLSAINIVIAGIFPHLEKKIDIKWKICSGIKTGAFFKYIGESLKLKNGPALKLPIIAIFTFLKFLFNQDLWKCQIINAHGADSWIPVVLLSKILKKTSIITLHETENYTKEHWFYGGKKMANWLWKWTLKNADYLIDISNTVKLGKSFYIPNGIDLSIFKPRFTEKKEKTILFVGRLRNQKGIEYFVKAIQIIKKHQTKEKIRSVVVTSSMLKVPEEEKYAKLIKENGIELHSRIPFKEIKKYYQEADVLVLSSVYEAFGLVLLEAMACGTPVVASNVGGIPNVVKDGFVGFLVPPRDSQVIAQKILVLLGNEKLREKMSENCLEWVKSFSWEKIAEKYLEIYYQVLTR
ncbi:glycosyltransferase family 4 protein [Candidatus Parcubacteria bacterium]|nr:glycosyltransferase family 4 protein [Candidatus Parcubacteria bacterium]